MNKNVAKFIIIILTLLLIAQLVYYKLIRNNNNEKIENDNNTTNYYKQQNEIKELNSIDKSSMQYKELFYPRLISELYDNNYKGPITKEDIAESIYKLTTGEIAKIYEALKDVPVYKIEEYYSENITEIRQLGIESEKDFLLICEEITNVLKTSAIYNYSVINIENAKSEDGYYIFNLNLVYNNDLSIHLKCKLPEESKSETIKYTSNSDISKIYERYNGIVSEDELIGTIYEFMNKISEIRQDTRMMSLNDEAKYFENNKSRLNLIGIYNIKDLQNIVYQINQIHWTENNELSYYIFTNYRETEEYATVDLNIIYDMRDNLKITIYLSKIQDETPSIKITAEDIIGDD